MSLPILLDCDPGHDDAIAILLALASPEVELLGITTVAGNQTLEKTTRNALVVLELAGRADVPVCVGASRPLARALRVAASVHGETGLDGPEVREPAIQPLAEDASDFLASRIDSDVVLVATGPLTNVALLLDRRPDAASRLGRIVWMGGAIAEGNVTPAAEFNAFVDPEAAARVFTSGADVTMVGLDVTHKALLTAAHAERLRAAGRIGGFVAELHAFFSAFHRERYGWDGAPIHDAMAVGHVVDPTLLSTVDANVEVETSSTFCDGRTVVDRWGVTDRPPNAHVGIDVDAERFLELLCSRLESLG